MSNHSHYANSSKGRIPADVARALAPPADPWTVERVRVALGLRPWPERFTDRGQGRTTKMLCELAAKVLNEPLLPISGAEQRTFVVVAYTTSYAERLVHDLRGMLAKLRDASFAREVSFLAVSYRDAPTPTAWRGRRIGGVGYDHFRGRTYPSG